MIFWKRGNHLTADDWGLSPGVNEGILTLAKLGHLRRVSVLAGGRHLNHKLAELKKIPGIEFGLHFNLTSRESGGEYQSPAGFLWDWWRFGKKGADLTRRVRKSLILQLAVLRKAGIKPTRLDSHHHVHAVPGLLAEIADILRREKIKQVRVPYHPSLWFGRRMPIAWLGLKLQKAARRLKFHTLTFYYPTRSDFSNMNRLIGVLNKISRAEILIHPAKVNDIAQAAPSDDYREERVDEFNLLRMLAFALRIQKRKG